MTETRSHQPSAEQDSVWTCIVRCLADFMSIVVSEVTPVANNNRLLKIREITAKLLAKARKLKRGQVKHEHEHESPISKTNQAADRVEPCLSLIAITIVELGSVSTCRLIEWTFDLRFAS